MKAPATTTAFRCLGVALFPFAGLFTFFSIGTSAPKSGDFMVCSLVIGIAIFATAVYFLFGAPGLEFGLKSLKAVVPGPIVPLPVLPKV